MVTISLVTQWNIYKSIKQAGAELCQAQGKLKLVWLCLDPYCQAQFKFSTSSVQFKIESDLVCKDL